MSNVMDESEGPTDNLSERVGANGWRVISNPVRRPSPEDDELTSLIRSMRERQSTREARGKNETDPPEAA
jgi:hypothetical protein